jgi:hypothetical protein
MRFMGGGQDRVLRERGGGRVSREFWGLESGAFLFLFLFSFFWWQLRLLWGREELEGGDVPERSNIA